ncbi:Glucan endo-1,3-beta-glucosidase-beta-glucanase, putative isoform 2 [Hibiscus syriacus]|uniref:Glucan endo-1,3-beta-glucosidase-beta-glucanase, putative isoform 2 n=1 Tax=Hibiscus syriacus TaxID=106335 RepID=A0A6A2YG61_HIBSY|nr:major pollen allergen Ole e 10-like isoform X2 [Hibiscus syriacus]KAE8674227.1 Glucan endo-1,3-beta-glucosidase-beta-glucanase, putative isoform 2 [Hibiscus syriacus]
MAKSTVSLPVFCLLLLSFDSGILLKLAKGQGKTWCVAKPSTDDAALASNINSACNDLGSLGWNCSQIQPNGACFEPDTLINHASFAMNSYYQAFGRQEHNCYFLSSGLVTISDPSYGNCQYV